MDYNLSQFSPFFRNSCPSTLKEMSKANKVMLIILSSYLQIIGGTPPSLAAKYQLVIMYIGAGTATIATLVASLLTIYVLIDSQYRIRAEKLYPRNEVNRIESLLKTFRFMTSHWTQWRTRVQQQQSPFPTYVNEPSPDAQSTQPLTASPSKFEESATGYGAPSASYQHTEDN